VTLTSPAPALIPLGVAVREAGISWAVATPIVVDGRLRGVIAAGSILKQPLPADTEARLASKLAAPVIANAETHAAIAASRARIVATADETRRRRRRRRRIERDLHDGTQQQLLELRAAKATQPPDVGELTA
jgi:signal transduction histidine kinase